MDIAALIAAVNSNRVRITDHADEEAASDRLSLDQVFISVQHGEIIEEYPTDRPYPSCLVLGFTGRNEPIHSVWAYNESNGWAVLVTVYRPDPLRWVDWRRRREQE